MKVKGPQMTCTFYLGSNVKCNALRFPLVRLVPYRSISSAWMCCQRINALALHLAQHNAKFTLACYAMPHSKRWSMHESISASGATEHPDKKTTQELRLDAIL